MMALEIKGQGSFKITWSLILAFTLDLSGSIDTLTDSGRDTWARPLTWTPETTCFKSVSTDPRISINALLIQCTCFRIISMLAQ